MLAIEFLKAVLLKYMPPFQNTLKNKDCSFEFKVIVHLVFSQPLLTSVASLQIKFLIEIFMSLKSE